MATDRELITIVDAALANATQKSGAWLACRPGCSQCCVGAFEINALDVERLQAGLTALRKERPDRAALLEARVNSYIERTRDLFPGDWTTGLLAQDESSRERFEDFANDEVCPVLAPETGTCELYSYRPMTCRVFGPPVRSDNGLGVCELCFVGATQAEMERCELIPDPEDLETALLAQMAERGSISGNSIVAYGLRQT